MLPGASPIVAAEEVCTTRATPASRAARNEQRRLLGVQALHRDLVLHAQRVDPRQVERQLAAVHPAPQCLLVERVAADHLGPAIGQGTRRRLRAGERSHLIAPLDQPRDERAADQPRAPGDEHAGHQPAERSAPEKRTMYSIPDQAVMIAATASAH